MFEAVHLQEFPSNASLDERVCPAASPDVVVRLRFAGKVAR